VLLPERGVLLAGDALATFDYVSGRRGVGLHRLNDDRDLALEALGRFDGLDADIVLCGHGDPFTGGLPKALDLARS
jgi:hypothetical protein